MINRRQSSVSSVVLITFSELAWLIVFILFVKIGQDKAQNEISPVSLKVANMASELGITTDDLGRYLRQDQLLVSYNKLFASYATPFDVSNTNVFEELLKKANRYSEIESALTEHGIYGMDALRNHFVQFKAFQKEIDSAKKETDRLQSSLGKEKQLNEQLQNQLAIQKSIIDRLSDKTIEMDIRREIAGIPNVPLNNVIILFDTSSSMRNNNTWDHALNIIKAWVQHLPVRNCAVIAFSDEAIAYPSDGWLQFRDNRGNINPETQMKLLRFIDQAPREDYTNTLAALEKAYERHETDLIILFSDGKPNPHYKSTNKTIEAIYKLIEKHDQIPILAVALGNYERIDREDRREDASVQLKFMKTIAKKSGGNFIAR